MAVISISLPDQLLEQADRFLAERGFAGRSELLRAALRDFLAAHAGEAREGTTSATVTLLYPHGGERKIGDIRHGFNDVIQSMMHGHAEHACVELFLVKGEAHRIRQFVDALRANKETEMVQAVYTDAEAKPDGHR